ncbi:PAC2 family protein [Candidatus Micrarchaeota archaeon]|nr:PAC2 family protein [Candidatus Micrarchaeota archaeon]
MIQARVPLAPSFTESSVRVRKQVKAQNAVLLMGLPGIGLVSKLAADHLVKSIGAEHVATIYSPHFPNQVLAEPSGMLKPFTLKFYHKHVRKRDLFVLRGDIQPLTVEGQYEVASKALKHFAASGGTEVIAMAGYAVNKKAEKPRIFCASTSKEVFESFEKLGCKKTESIVPIVGMAGLVPALSPLYGMRGTCLLVETPGTNFDATGAAALLDLIGKRLGEKFDAKGLEAQARKAQSLVEKIEKQARAEASKASSTTAASEARKDAVTYIR